MTARVTALPPLEVLRILGLTVRTDGGKIFVSPSELVDDSVRWLASTHRAEIIADLQNDKPVLSHSGKSVHPARCATKETDE